MSLHKKKKDSSLSKYLTFPIHVQQSANQIQCKCCISISSIITVYVLTFLGRK